MTNLIFYFKSKSTFSSVLVDEIFCGLCRFRQATSDAIICQYVLKILRTTGSTTKCHINLHYTLINKTACIIKTVFEETLIFLKRLQGFMSHFFIYETVRHITLIGVIYCNLYKQKKRANEYACTYPHVFAIKIMCVRSLIRMFRNPFFLLFRGHEGNNSFWFRTKRI